MRTFTRVEELTIMKVIAETLNHCNDMHEMLQTVLERLLKLTHLEAGWIFLVDEEPRYTLMADYGLPPGARKRGKNADVFGRLSLSAPLLERQADRAGQHYRMQTDHRSCEKQTWRHGGNLPPCDDPSR